MVLYRSVSNVGTFQLFRLGFYFSDLVGSGGKVVRTARVPMGGWAEGGKAASRHHQPLPEETSEDELPPHIHKVQSSLCGRSNSVTLPVFGANIKFCLLSFFSLSSGYIIKPCEQVSTS